MIARSPCPFSHIMGCFVQRLANAAVGAPRGCAAGPSFLRRPDARAWLVCRGATGRSDGFVVVAGRPIPAMELTAVPRNIHAPGISPRLGMASLSPRGREPSYLGCFGRPLHAVRFAHSPPQNRRAKSKTPQALWRGMALGMGRVSTGPRTVRTCFTLRMPHQKTRGVRVLSSDLCRLPHRPGELCRNSAPASIPCTAARIIGPPG